MEIIINNEQYKYYFVGESFCRPSMDSFGITEADIISYNKYMENYKKLESKRDDVESGVSCFLGVIIYIGELLLLLFEGSVPLLAASDAAASSAAVSG